MINVKIYNMFQYLRNDKVLNNDKRGIRALKL